MRTVAVILPVLLAVLLFAFGFLLAKGKSPRVRAMADKLGFRKADEMEQKLQDQSVRIAYFVLLAGLLAENWYTALVRGEQSRSMPLLALAIVVQAVSLLVLRCRAVEGDEEYREWPLWATLAVLLAIAAVITVVGCFLLFSATAHVYGG